MMIERYIYPAIFDYDTDGIAVEFPDLPGCLTCGDDIDEAVKNAKECLGLHLYGMRKDNDPIPESTPVYKIKCEENQEIRLIEADVVIELLENESILRIVEERDKNDSGVRLTTEEIIERRKALRS